MMSCAGGRVNLKFSGTPWPVNDMLTRERCARGHETVVGRIRPHRSARRRVSTALRGTPTFEDVSELLDRARLEVDDLGLPRPDGRAATPVQLDLALGLLGRLLDRIVAAVGGTALACGSTFSCSVGSSLLPGGTLCSASARLGLRLVRSVTST